MSGTRDQADSTDGHEGKSKRARRKFVLCFDGTGNKFQGTAGDSNILKIYSMLERTDKTQFHYYQPGIGTYSAGKALSTSSTVARIASWYAKAKDSAIGTTLDEHVMAGYRFLMRYYQDGDDIFFFGFSRGAYIARFLAELLDHVGLLSTGNEELVRFVWKTFARWQQRPGGDDQAQEKERELFKFMKTFRETFSRPVRRIRFLGLFDTVNSVSKFEIPWMQRSHRSPYTVHSSAIRICHAVSIDERRAKFRQDLISQNAEPPRPGHLEHFRRASHVFLNGKDEKELAPIQEKPYKRFRSRSRGRSRSPGDRPSFGSGNSDFSANADPSADSDDDEDTPQSITELWFPGCHADIGGGWDPDPQDNLSLSHLVWMIREAQKAGLVFNTEKMRELSCYYDDPEIHPVPKARGRPSRNDRLSIPIIELNDDIVPASKTLSRVRSVPGDEDEEEEEGDGVALKRMTHGRSAGNSKFIEYLHASCTRGKIHDPLQRKTGTSTMRVLTWNIMEFLPFRRMDLRPDGTWKVIWWPLPMGEVRDVPLDVKVHNSAIRRMREDEDYRPGNLIIGGGGRGMRRAPKGVGIGEWVVLEEAKGHPIDEIWVRAGTKEKMEGVIWRKW